MLLTYIVLSLAAGVVGVAFDYVDSAAKWLLTPPLLLVLAGGVSFFIAFVWWG